MSDNDNTENPSGTGYRGAGKTGWRSEEVEPGDNGCVGGTKEKPCNGFTILGSNRCYFHTHPTKRHEIKQQKAARELIYVLEDSVFNNEFTAVSPLEGLQHEMYRTLAIIRWLGAKLDVMAREDPAALAQIVTNEVEEATRPIKDRQKTITANVMRRELGRTQSGLSPWLVWYLRERDHFVRVCGIIANLNVKMLQLEWPKRTGELLMEAMQATMFELGLDPHDKGNVQAILRGLEFAAPDVKVKPDPINADIWAEDLSTPASEPPTSAGGSAPAPQHRFADPDH
jgi:hypothetical protein